MQKSAAPETILIIIPTVGTPDVVIPTIESLSEHTDGFDLRVVVVNNPVAQNAMVANELAVTLESKSQPSVSHTMGGFDVKVRSLPGPVGFSPALNEGLRFAKESMFAGWPMSRFDACQYVIFLNDDVRPTHGWLRAMVDAMEATEITDPNEPAEPDGSRLKHPAADYGEIGMVGPMSNCVAGRQLLPPDALADLASTTPDAFARWLAETDKNGAFASDFVSGFCVMFSKAAMYKIMAFRKEHDPKNLFWNEAFLPSGFEDNELCMIAGRLGFRAVIAGNSFVYHLGHQSFDAFFKEARRGMANRLTYYDEARRLAASPSAGNLIFPKKNRIVAIIRFGPEVENDMAQFDVTVTQLGRVVDYIMVLYTKPKPGEGVMGDLAAEADRIEDLSGVDARVFYEHGRDERTERNDLIARIREEFCDATWAMSVDHDEWIEPRITRDHLERLMAHPDPMVEAYLFRFPTFWNTTGTVNLNHPWGDDGTYTGGASGWRFFRLNPTSQKKIIAGRPNGLHCGNIPPSDGMTKRVAAVRMKHMGYLNREDRIRKYKRYCQLDPNPNPALVGGPSYSHIVATENQKMSEWTDQNGITLVLLVSPSEDPNKLGDMLDQLYGVVDRIVLTWTGAWSSERIKTTMNAMDFYGDGDGGEVKATTLILKEELRDGLFPESAEGPSPAMLKMAAHFGCEWVHHAFTTFDETRNAAISAASVEGTWLLSLDPDEGLGNPHLTALQLVRMAENTDSVGWQFRFANPSAVAGPNGQPFVSTSEAIRMWRVNRGIEWTGPVHETLTASIRRTGGRIRIAPFMLTNMGMIRTPQELQRKYDFYVELAMRGVLENPWWETGWQTIGLYFRELGDHSFADQMFGAAIAANNDAYLPLRIAADHKMQEVIALLEESEERMGNHPNREQARKMTTFLREQFAVPPLLTDPPSASWYGKSSEALRRLQPALQELLQRR